MYLDLTIYMFEGYEHCQIVKCISGATAYKIIVRGTPVLLGSDVRCYHESNESWPLKTVLL